MGGWWELFGADVTGHAVLERNETFIWRCRRRLTARSVGKTKVLFGTAAEALIKTKVLFGAAHEALIK